MLASIHLVGTPELWSAKRAAYVKAFTFGVVFELAPLVATRPPVLYRRRTAKERQASDCDAARPTLDFQVRHPFQEFCFPERRGRRQRTEHARDFVGGVIVRLVHDLGESRIIAAMISRSAWLAPHFANSPLRGPPNSDGYPSSPFGLSGETPFHLRKKVSCRI
jgi:hypothetical protein